MGGVFGWCFGQHPAALPVTVLYGSLMNWVRSTWSADVTCVKPWRNDFADFNCDLIHSFKEIKFTDTGFVCICHLAIGAIISSWQGIWGPVWPNLSVTIVLLTTNKSWMNRILSLKMSKNSLWLTNKDPQLWIKQRLRCSNLLCVTSSFIVNWLSLCINGLQQLLYYKSTLFCYTELTAPRAVTKLLLRS